MNSNRSSYAGQVSSRMRGAVLAVDCRFLLFNMVSKAKWPGGRFEATFRLAVFSFVGGVRGCCLNTTQIGLDKARDLSRSQHFKSRGLSGCQLSADGSCSAPTHGPLAFGMPPHLGSSKG